MNFINQKLIDFSIIIYVGFKMFCSYMQLLPALSLRPFQREKGDVWRRNLLMRSQLHSQGCPMLQCQHLVLCGKFKSKFKYVSMAKKCSQRLKKSG